MRPKETFLLGPHRKAFEEIVQTEAFRQALDYALLTMMDGQSLFGSAADNWDAHSQLAGARRFADILRNLHLAEPAMKKQVLPNLKLPTI